MTRRKIPAVVAMVATPDKITYSGAFGKRDSASGIGVKPDSIFFIASMTKAITTTAALQLVERGKLTLDEPVSKHLPELAKLDVLQGFDKSGKPILRPASKPVTLKHLLTHTSGLRLRHLGRKHVEVRRAARRAPSRNSGSAHSADLRTRHPLAVRNGPGLDREAGGEGERPVARRLFSAQHPSAAGYERYQLHRARRKVRSSGEPLSPPTGRHPQTGPAQAPRLHRRPSTVAAVYLPPLPTMFASCK